MKIICIGRNYAEHAKELQNEIPDEPVIFIKPDTAVLRNNSPFYIPDFSKDVHHEVELFVKITKVGKSIPLQFASTYYNQIGLGIDFTARDLQTNLKAKGLPWEKAKGFDYSAVIGKLYAKENFDIHNIDFTLVKNGETIQSGNSSQMLFGVDSIISYVSQFFTLKIGDLIFTGTPPGVGPVKKGDCLEGFIGESSAFQCEVK